MALARIALASIACTAGNPAARRLVFPLFFGSFSIARATMIAIPHANTAPEQVQPREKFFRSSIEGAAIQLP